VFRGSTNVNPSIVFGGLDWHVMAVSGGPIKALGIVPILGAKGFSTLGDAAVPPFAGGWHQGNLILSAQRGHTENVWSVPVSMKSYEFRGLGDSVQCAVFVQDCPGTGEVIYQRIPNRQLRCALRAKSSARYSSA